MKNLVYFFFIVFILGFTSCSNNPEKQISGTWKISDIQSTQEIPESDIETYKKVIEETKSTSVLVFNEDKTYQSTVYNQTTKGKWEISEDSKVLIITDQDGITAKSNIKELSSNEMVLETVDEGFVTTLYLKKQ